MFFSQQTQLYAYTKYWVSERLGERKKRVWERVVKMRERNRERECVCERESEREWVNEWKWERKRGELVKVCVGETE